MDGISRKLTPSSKWAWQWVLLCGLAELCGIALAAVWWVVIDLLQPKPTSALMFALVLLAKSCAGLLEGFILGAAQGLHLRRLLPGLDLASWITATCAIAVFGWLIGSAIPMSIEAQAASTQQPAFDPPPLQTALFAAVFGTLVGIIFGTAQWLVLRTAAVSAHWWIIGNALGWGFALPVIYVAASAGDPQTPLANAVMLGVAAGMGAGLMIGLATLWSIRRMQQRA